MKKTGFLLIPAFFILYSGAAMAQDNKGCAKLASDFLSKTNQANYCEVDQDCALLELRLPCSFFGCQTYVNVKEKQALEEYWKSHSGNDCAACMRECPGAEPVCHKNKCLPDYEARTLRMTESGKEALKPGDKGFISDGGDSGWRVLSDKCAQRITDRESCKQCLSGFDLAGIGPDTDINEIREGYIETSVFKVLDTAFPGAIKVFVYSDFAVDEEGNIYTHGESG